MIQKTYKEGEVIFQEGDPSRFVCRIVTGEVGILKEVAQQPVVLGTATAGEYVGEMGVIEDKSRSATVRTKTEVTADLMNKEEFLRLISEDTTSAYQLISRLCERLRTVDQKFAEATVFKDVRSHRNKDLSGRRDSTSLPFFEESPFESQEGEITILLNSDMAAAKFPPDGIPITEFPFTVGRRPDPQDKAPFLKINLPLQDKPPYRLSRIHFALDKTSKGFLIRDLGSTLGTQVNREYLGNDFAQDFIHLKSGENMVIAGGMGSPFVFRVLVKNSPWIR